MIISKRGQVAETMTWIVSTLIILIILIVSVFLSSLVGHSKVFPTSNKVDIFADKSLTAYLLTKDATGPSVYDEISTIGFNDFNGNLAVVIFKNLYGGFYNEAVFLGIDTGAFFNPVQANKYFNAPAGDTPTSLVGRGVDDSSIVEHFIILKNAEFLRLVLWHG